MPSVNRLIGPREGQGQVQSQGQSQGKIKDQCQGQSLDKKVQCHNIDHGHDKI